MQTTTNPTTPAAAPEVAKATTAEPAAAKDPKPTKKPRLSENLRAKADRIIAARDKKKASATRGGRPPKAKPAEAEEDLVVFAFRLSAEERELIHQAAGPAKASRFVRALAVAAAKRDEAAVRKLIATVS